MRLDYKLLQIKVREMITCHPLVELRQLIGNDASLLPAIQLQATEPLRHLNDVTRNRHDLITTFDVCNTSPNLIKNRHSMKTTRVSYDGIVRNARSLLINVDPTRHPHN